MVTAVTTPTPGTGINNYNIIGHTNTSNFSMKVKFVELPNPTFSLVLEMTGKSVLDPRRPYTKALGRNKVTKLLYGKVRFPRPLNAWGSRKRSALLTIPSPGFRFYHGFVVMQYLPFINTGAGDAAVVTRVYVMLWDRLPPERRVSEAVAAGLAFVARKFNARAVGEPITLSILSHVLGREDSLGEVSGVKVKMWFLNNLPPLPHVEYSTLPLKSIKPKGESDGGSG